MGVKQFFKRFAVWIIALIVWFFLRGKLGTYTYDNADRYLFFIFIAYEGYNAFVGFLKYHTPQLVTEGHHFSNYSGGEPVGDWLVFRGGDAQGFGFSFEGQDATIILPKYLTQSLGKNIVSTVRTERWDYEELAPEIRGVIKTFDFTTENIIVGLVPTSFEITNPEFVESILQMRDENTVITRKDLIMKKDFTQVEEMASSAARIGDRISGEKGFLRKLGFGRSEQQPQQQPPRPPP